MRFCKLPVPAPRTRVPKMRPRFDFGSQFVSLRVHSAGYGRRADDHAAHVALMVSYNWLERRWYDFVGAARLLSEEDYREIS